MAKEAALELTPEEAKEVPMVDLVYELLKQSEEPLHYRDLTEKVAEIKGLTEEGMRSYMAQLYTDINIDGRFVCVGRSLWGLKERYTLDQASDAAVAASVKDDYDDDDYLDEEESEYDERDTRDEEDDLLVSEDEDFGDDIGVDD